MNKRRRGRRRKNRARPIPKWLKTSDQLDAVARDRCLMLLSVLSGEKPVTDAISEANISRGTYYQLETRALGAMLRSLAPGASDVETESGPSRLIAQLEAKVRHLERARRRSERLLLMTRRLVKTTSPAKPRKTVSTASGSNRFPHSRRKEQGAGPNSTPTATGVAEP